MDEEFKKSEEFELYLAKFKARHPEIFPFGDRELHVKATPKPDAQSKAAGDDWDSVEVEVEEEETL